MAILLLLWLAGTALLTLSWGWGGFGLGILAGLVCVVIVEAAR
jgi:hypothetical protein